MRQLLLPPLADENQHLLGIPAARAIYLIAG